MPYQKRKVDSNQAELTDELRKLGISVQPIHTIGHGVPDLLCGIAGVNILIELKSDKKSSLTPDEIKWNKMWKGQSAKAITMIGCLRMITGHLSKFNTEEAHLEMTKLKEVLNGLERKTS